MEMVHGSIYQQLLGSEFSRLGSVLQHVHGSAPLVKARGTVAVVHGKGWLIRLANRINKVPAPQSAAVLHLEIQRSPDQETWIRNFGNQPLITRQWAKDGLFVEAVGPIKMEMRLSIVGNRLVFEPVRTRVWGIKVPKSLGVSVYAAVEEEGLGWHVLVETKSALLGLLFSYTGKIELEQ